MGDYVANQVIKCMNKNGILVKDSSILIFGFTFKENCRDIRYTKVIDTYNTLAEYTNHIVVFDPWTDRGKVKNEYGIDLFADSYEKIKGKFDVVNLSVAHKEFLSVFIREFFKDTKLGVIYDVKGVLPKECTNCRL
jgi:UDP-N-acetyl-D-galactosamine dehydrogenase